MKMKFVYICIFILAFIFIACGGNASSGVSKNKNSNINNEVSLLYGILQSGVIRVGTTGDWNPMTYRDSSNGEYIGHDIDLVKALAKDMGVTVKFIPTDWKNIVSGLVAGKYDITTQASYNMGRAKSIAYSSPIQGVGTVPLTLKKNLSNYSSWEDLNNSSVKLVTTLGTVQEEQMKVLLPDASRITVEAPIRDFQEVLAGRADVSVTSNIEAAQLIKIYPDLVVIPVEPQFPTPMGLLLPQADTIFKDYINVWLTLKRQNGYIDQLKEKWISLK